MRILYGVVGEGMGHAIRSQVLIEHLIKEGHEVEIMASSRAEEFLSSRFENVHEIHGFHIVSEENRVRRGKTILSNIIKGTQGIPQQIKAYFKMTEDFAPETVISDFETWSSFYGESHRIPVFSVDNMQIIDRCTLAKESIKGQRKNFEFTRAFIRGKVPFSEFYFITTFFYPPIKRSRTALFPPILRTEILRAESRKGDHLLVYQNSTSHGQLIEALKSTGLECRIYGLKRGISEEIVEGDLRYRPFSEDQFIDDLASAKAVVASAGFTLMGECIYLHKPLLAAPLEEQFEQTLNARYLEIEGFGMAAENGVDEDTLAAFVNTIPVYEENLASYSQDGNTLLLDALDEHLDRAAAGMYELYPGRGNLQSLLEKYTPE